MAQQDADQQLLSIYEVYKKEAGQACVERLLKNKQNFDSFHMRQDFNYKSKGQSREFLPKLKMAVEQSANFLQQGLVQGEEWFRVYPSTGLTSDHLRVKPRWIQALLERQLEKANFYTFTGDATKLGLLASLLVAKVGGQYKAKAKYVVEKKSVGGTMKTKLVKKEDKRWQLQVSLVQPEDFRIDPTGNGLYYMHDMYMDYYQVMQLATGKDAIYDKAAVEALKGSGANASTDRDASRSRETGQNIANNGNRKRVKVTEVWGNFVDSDGELVWENHVATIANDKFVIQKPTANPLWHGETPFVVTPILTVPGSVYGSALADAPAALNNALNEMFNLILDGGLMAVHGIKQIRTDWLEDPSQVEDGIPAGETLRVTSACPPGATVLERVDTSSVPADGINVYNLLNQEFVTAAMTNDFRMGVQSQREVKATQIVESSNAITSMFSGLAEHLEVNFIKPILEKAWKTCAQNMDDLDEDEIKACIGEEAQTELLAMGKEELFAETVQGTQYEVFGISAALNKQRDFTKLTAMLQTVASAPILMEEFTSKYDFTKLLGEIMRSLDINTAKIEADDAKDQQSGQVPQQVTPAPAAGPNMQSQIPQAGAAVNQGADSANAIPQPDFPPSRATPAGM